MTGEEITEEVTEQPPQKDRATLIRDIAMFQVKLLVDGFRDLLLVPASLVAGVISLFSSSREHDTLFYDLLRAGRRSERYINLFGALDRHAGDSVVVANEDSPEDIDRMATRVEDFMRDEYRNGHLTGQARERLENALERLRRAARQDS